MSDQRSPEWNSANGDIDVVMHSIESIPPSRGRWDLVSQRKYDVLQGSYSPGNEHEELRLDNGQLLVVTPSLGFKEHKQRNWLRNSSTGFPILSETESTIAFERPQSLQKAASHEAPPSDLGDNVGSSACDAYMQEDEMIPWLNYPLDEPLEKYCSEFVMNSLNLSKGHVRCDTDDHGQSLNAINNKESHTSLSNAMDNDKDNAKELVSLPKAQAATTIHSSKYTATSKHEDSGFPTDSENKETILITSNQITPTLGSHIAQTLLPKTTQGAIVNDTPLLTTRASRNFSHFSKPALAVKERIQMLSMAARLTETERFEQLDKVIAAGYMLSKRPQQPVVTELNLQPNKSDCKMPLDAASRCPKTDAIGVQQCMESISCTENSGLKLQTDNVTNQSVNREPSCSNHCAASSGVLGTEKGIGIIEGLVPTVSSFSGGSGNSVVRNEKVAETMEKRKAQGGVDSECQSKGPTDGRGHGKKSSPSQFSSLKRSRAAEIHNQSERRRRDKINEKLKALQELIPNSNKTDKASLLEEAIEYLKMLQMQLQVMAFRSGMSIPPMLIPPGIQQLQMSQMAALPRMHMGLGMGMGMLDTGAAAASRHVLALPPFPGFSIPGSASICNSAVTPQGHVVASIPGPVLPVVGIASQSPPVPGGLPILKAPEHMVFSTSHNQPQACTQASCYKTTGALLS